MHLFLHIGTEKTGTTSIQEFLRANRAALRQRGVLVPDSLVHGTTGNHRRLVAIVADESARDDFYAEVGIIDFDKRREKVAAWRAAFDNELVEASACDTAIITSEHLHSRLRREGEVVRLKEFLNSRFSSISVVLYLRDPLDTMLASVSTIVKAGGKLIEVPDPADSGWRVLLDHKNTLQLWERVFGIGAVIPRLFLPDELKGGDVVSDFAAVSGLELGDLDIPARTNESLSLVGMQVLAQVNEKVPRVLSQGGINPARGRLTEVFSECFTTGPRLQASNEVVESYGGAFFESNEWVRRRFFPSRETLFPSKPRVEPTSSELAAEDLEDIARLIVMLWENRRRS